MFKGPLILVFCIPFFLGACKNVRDDSDNRKDNISDPSQHSENLVRYAKGFSIIAEADYRILILHDPWNEEGELGRFLIGFGKSDDPSVKKLSSPARLAVSSTTQIGFLLELGVSHLLSGCTNPDRIYDADLYQRYLDGELINLGRDMEFNIEAMVENDPDLILQTTFQGQLIKDARLREIGIPIVYFHEWMEKTPLGRAEWIKVIGLITGKYEEADSLFSEIERRYLSYCKLVVSSKDKPLVLPGNNFKGTWFVPGGENYMSRFYRDAGLSYPYYENDKVGSLSLGIETVLDQFEEADVWIGVSAGSMEELLLDDDRYRYFSPFKTGRVYSLNGRTSPSGGNDFWERAICRPDLVLADLISIAHPDLMFDHSLHYYQQLSKNR